MRNKRILLRRVITLAILVIAAAVICTVVLLNHYYPLRYTDIIRKYAQEYDLKPELVCAVIKAESGFNKDAVSSVGASGLMQVMEGTANWLAPKISMDGFEYTQIFDPDVNIRLGCFYLNMLEKQYGDIDVALCAYNAGSGNVDKWLRDSSYSDDGKTLSHIPFQETRNYVKKVTDIQRIYKFMLAFSG